MQMKNVSDEDFLILKRVWERNLNLVLVEDKCFAVHDYISEVLSVWIC